MARSRHHNPPLMRNHLRELRYARTRASNVVRSNIQWMLTDEAKFVMPDGLPSWWPFWSDVLWRNVREAVKAARALETAEARIEGRAPRI